LFPVVAVSDPPWCWADWTISISAFRLRWSIEHSSRLDCQPADAFMCGRTADSMAYFHSAGISGRFRSIAVASRSALWWSTRWSGADLDPVRIGQW
jgi:hypothetical protein